MIEITVNDIRYDVNDFKLNESDYEKLYSLVDALDKWDDDEITLENHLSQGQTWNWLPGHELGLVQGGTE